jgi:NAD(P)-dependent dehydrogenase (short-subunit alcohol dehydrogenase family)
VFLERGGRREEGTRMTETDCLRGKVVLITGAARNLGAVAAEEFVCRGARVAVAHVQITPDSRAQIAALNRGGGQAAEFTADVRDPEQIRSLAASVRESLGPVDVLVNNTGPFTLEPFLSLPVEEWNRIMDANLRSVYLLAQQVAEGMNSRGWGRIINLCAGSAFLRNHSVYGLAKAGVRFLTEALALEMAPGVTVNAIAPGQIAESACDMAEFDPTFVERVMRITPTGRLVSRRDVARMIVSLCEPSWDTVTGMTLPMDGGARIPRF